MAKPPTIRPVTASARERINRLAEILYRFLPLSSRSPNAVTFTSIFAESDVAGYLEGQENKTQALQQGFSELYRRHKRLPSMIIRKIVPAAIEYRRYHRKPLKRTELDALSECLASLGIDMSAELAQVEIDESLPRITVPPEQLKQWLRGCDLEPALATDPLQLFEEGHFNEAVRKGAERFEDRVRDLSGLDTYGRDLMARAFSDACLLKIDSLEPENQADFQKGFKLMTMGAMAAIRNVFSHGDEERRSPEECFEMLLLLNWFFRALTVPDDTGN